jgi:hypothetical protein
MFNILAAWRFFVSYPLSLLITTAGELTLLPRWELALEVRIAMESRYAPTKPPSR